MGKKAEFTGQRFGKIEVIKYDEKKHKWECKCDCNNIVYRSTTYISSGKCVDCGCERENKYNLEGKIFGMLEVIKKVKGGWECKCECGRNNIIRRTNSLITGMSTHCGCLNNNLKTNDLAGKKIGEWEVLYRVKNGYYSCKCSCGIIKNVSGTSLRNGKSYSCGHLQKNKNGGYIRKIKRALIKKQTVTTVRKINKYKIGGVFGEWTIIGYVGKGKYRCRCSCGLVKENYMHKISNSCGHSEFIGKIFGKLTVTKRIEGGKHLCECECGNKDVEVYTTNLINGSASSCGCSRKTSKYELELSSLFENSIRNKMLISSKEGNKQQIDIYIKDKKIGIEFNGDYWHSFPKKLANYHWEKTKRAEYEGIELLHIFEHEWVSQKEKIINYLDNKIKSKNTIYGRKCKVVKIESKESKEFEDKYHINGSAKALIYLGLKYEEELVAVMTLGKSRFDKNYEYELVRLVYGEYRVVGGSEKLFNYFIENYNPKSIVSYCDRSKFTGKVYERLGFKYLSHTQPNYKWVKYSGNNLVDIKNRMQTQKHKLIEQGLGTKEQTEYEIMSSLRYFKIYDCGNDKYEWIKSK